MKEWLKLVWSSPLLLFLVAAAMGCMGLGVAMLYIALTVGSTMYSPTIERIADQQFATIYSEVSDVTPCAAPFKLRHLVDQCPSLEGYSRKTQKDVLRAFVRNAGELPDEADRIVRVGGGLRWTFAKDAHRLRDVDPDEVDWFKKRTM